MISKQYFVPNVSCTFPTNMTLIPNTLNVSFNCTSSKCLLFNIMLTVLIAVAVPDLEPFVGLVGALFSSTLVLFFPAVIELVTFWEDEAYMGPFRWRVYKNVLLILMWLVVLVTGAKSSIGDIVDLYS